MTPQRVELTLPVIWIPDPQLRALAPDNDYGVAEILESLEEWDPASWGFPSFPIRVSPRLKDQVLEAHWFDIGYITREKSDRLECIVVLQEVDVSQGTTVFLLEVMDRHYIFDVTQDRSSRMRRGDGFQAQHTPALSILIPLSPLQVCLICKIATGALHESGLTLSDNRF
jgi:hypothetical protein